MVVDPTADLMALDDQFDNLLSFKVRNLLGREAAALIRMGADPHVPYGFGKFLPLSYAIDEPDLGLVSALIAAGVDVNQRCTLRFSEDPLAMRAIHRVYDPDGTTRTADGVEARENRPQTIPIAMALIRARPDLSQKGALGMNYLHAAGLAAEPSLMAELLKRGEARLQIVDNATRQIVMWYDGFKDVFPRKSFPIHYVAMGGSVGTLAALMLPVAPQLRRELANAQAANGETPAHLAARYKRTDMLAALQEYGADMSVRDGNGMTPLQVARHAKSVKKGKALITFTGNVSASEMSRGIEELSRTVASGFRAYFLPVVRGGGPGTAGGYRSSSTKITYDSRLKLVANASNRLSGFLH
jgi:ankyrin repeat protein